MAFETSQTAEKRRANVNPPGKNGEEPPPPQIIKGKPITEALNPQTQARVSHQAREFIRRSAWPTTMAQEMGKGKAYPEDLRAFNQALRLVAAMAESKNGHTVLSETISPDLLIDLLNDVLERGTNQALVAELTTDLKTLRERKIKLTDYSPSSTLTHQLIDDVLKDSQNARLLEELRAQIKKAQDLQRLGLESVIKLDALRKLVTTYRQLDAIQTQLQKDIGSLGELKKIREQLTSLNISASEESIFEAELKTAIAAMQAKEKTPIPENLEALVTRIDELLKKDEKQTLQTSPRGKMIERKRAGFLAERTVLVQKLLPGQTKELATIEEEEQTFIDSVFEPPQTKTLQEFIEMEEKALEAGTQVKTARQIGEPDPGVLDATGMLEATMAAELNHRPTQEKDAILKTVGEPIKRDLEQFRNKKFVVLDRIERLTIFLKLLLRNRELTERRSELLETHQLTNEEELRQKLETEYEEVYGLYLSTKAEVARVASHVYERGAEGI